MYLENEFSTAQGMELQVKTFASVLQPLQLHKTMQDWLDEDVERTRDDDAFTNVLDEAHKIATEM